MFRIRMAALIARASWPSAGKNLNSTDIGMTIQSGMRMRPIAAMNSDTVVVANTKYARVQGWARSGDYSRRRNGNSVRYTFKRGRGERSERVGPEIRRER